MSLQIYVDVHIDCHSILMQWNFSFYYSLMMLLILVMSLDNKFFSL